MGVQFKISVPAGSDSHRAVVNEGGPVSIEGDLAVWTLPFANATLERLEHGFSIVWSNPDVRRLVIEKTDG